MQRLFIASLILSILFTLYDAYAEEKLVIIPLGAADPSFDPQVKDRPEEWYKPQILEINVGDTVTWINEDNQKHTVTSGKGSGRFGFIEGKMGEADGIFDSGLFSTKERWSYTFNKEGTFTYFCSIHPWMSGAINVVAKMPDYPVNENGERISLPLMSTTPDKMYHTGIYWSPVVIKTGEQILFTNDFFDGSGTNKLHLLKYEFVLIQNGNEIHRSTGYAERGSDVKYFVFSEPGVVTIRFEKLGGSEDYAEYKTIVYKGEKEPVDTIVISSNKLDPIFINLSTYGFMIGLIGAVSAIIVWWRKKK